MRIRTVVAVSAGCVTLAACEGLKDALSAHVDVVARTVSQTLTVSRLSTLLSNAKIPVAITRDNAMTLAGYWASYQRLAYAAAHNDTLKDKINVAVQPIVDNQRVSMFIDTLRSKFKTDSGNEAGYNAGKNDLYAARHILFAYPTAATPAQKDSVMKAAMAIKPQLTAANFAEMAKKYSTDKGSAVQGGSLGVFPKKTMVAEFSNATAALKPGEISGPVVSQFGVHFIQRLSWADAKDQYLAAYQEAAMAAHDSALSDDLVKKSSLAVKADAATNVRAALKDETAHRDDHSTLATYNRGGKFTVADLLLWVDVMPSQIRGQVLQGLPARPDSDLASFTKDMALRAILLRGADSAKIDVPAQQKTALQDQFRDLVTQMWQDLGVSPKDLADSGKSESDRAAYAARHVDRFVEQFMAGEATPPPIPVPLDLVLNAKYKETINSAGIDRAVEEGNKAKSADSAKAGPPPSSSVPMPSAPMPSAPPPSTGTKGTKPPGNL